MIRSVLALTLMLASCAAPVRAHDEGDGDHGHGPKLEDVAKLTVRGNAELEKPADQVRLRVGVVTDAKEAGDALRENTDRMEEVVEAIERAGVVEDEYETGQFRIRPQYSRRPRQAEPDWTPTIIGYEVVNSVVIRTRKLELAGDVIQAANTAGANSVEVEAFELADERTHRREAIETATRHAVEDARTLAAAANLRLVRIITINLDNTPVASADVGMSSRVRSAVAAESAPPITPGDVTVRANVTVVYEIAPRE